MELTKEEMELVIGWLKDHYYGREWNGKFGSASKGEYVDTENLPEVLTKFQTYLKGGEN